MGLLHSEREAGKEGGRGGDRVGAGGLVVHFGSHDCLVLLGLRHQLRHVIL